MVPQMVLRRADGERQVSEPPGRVSCLSRMAACWGPSSLVLGTFFSRRVYRAADDGRCWASGAPCGAG